MADYCTKASRNTKQDTNQDTPSMKESKETNSTNAEQEPTNKNQPEFFINDDFVEKCLSYQKARKELKETIFNETNSNTLLISEQSSLDGSRQMQCCDNSIQNSSAFQQQFIQNPQKLSPKNTQRTASFFFGNFTFSSEAQTQRILHFPVCSSSQDNFYSNAENAAIKDSQPVTSFHSGNSLQDFNFSKSKKEDKILDYFPKDLEAKNNHSLLLLSSEQQEDLVQQNKHASLTDYECELVPSLESVSNQNDTSQCPDSLLVNNQFIQSSPQQELENSELTLISSILDSSSSIWNENTTEKEDIPLCLLYRKMAKNNVNKCILQQFIRYILIAGDDVVLECLDSKEKRLPTIRKELKNFIHNKKLNNSLVLSFINSKRYRDHFCYFLQFYAIEHFQKSNCQDKLSIFVCIAFFFRCFRNSLLKKEVVTYNKSKYFKTSNKRIKM